MIKVYGIYGKTTAIMRIYTRSGLAYIEPEFKRGRLGLGKMSTAATYSTGDRTEQSIIEDSPLFGGTIKLLRVYGSEGNEVAAPLATEKPEAAEVTLTAVPEVTTKEQAIALLKSKGAKAVQLRSDEAIKAFAEKVGISFPNLTL